MATQPSRIQTFPFELLSEIFRLLDPTYLDRRFIVCSFVCRHWRQAALSDGTLWTMIRISEYDFYEEKRNELLADLLTRSRTLPLAVVLMRFRGPNVPEYYDALEEFLYDVLKPNLWRIRRILIIAPQTTWPVILNAMEGEQFPWLERLCLRSDAVKTMYKLQNAQHERIWQLPGDYPMPEVDDLPGIPVFDLVFPLPHGHRLEVFDTQGISFGNAFLPQLQCLYIAHHMPQMVTKGELTDALFATEKLVLQGMYVPSVGVNRDLPFDVSIDRSGDWFQPLDWEIRPQMDYCEYRRHDHFTPIDEGDEYAEEDEEAEAEQQPSSKCKIKELHLINLVAEPIPGMPVLEGDFAWGDLGEEDCAPFFRQLVEHTTASLQTLFIHGWHADSRIWKDFIKVYGPQTRNSSTAATTSTWPPTAAGEISELVEFPLLASVRIWNMCVPRSFQPGDLKRLFATMPAVTQLDLAYTVAAETASAGENVFAESEKQFTDACVQVLEEDMVLCPQLQEFLINGTAMKRTPRT
ncbi:F-box domain-containing protein [Mycena indigotica]|uniref:F-box domain-containing protein n=1 Tax=Mycena indigotica TaxID=2126181 RepID=A0A8H6S4S2_9AGAR|nr:F-box domain-containing protein [Mycena indigotica]KAF7292806.1 F-box domain-containing protein [Mycena indigotica]